MRSLNQPDSGETRALAIARDLRSKVVRGELRPGEQLPSWDVLGRTYGVTRTTLNRVFGRLKADGFVYSSSTRGTFVVDYPPHLFRYAIAFPTNPDTPGWNRFWWTLANQAVVVHESGPRKVECFYEVQNHVDNEPHTLLSSQMASDRVAGLIIVGYPQMVSQGIWDRQDVPKVGIWSGSHGWPTPSISVDLQSFIRRSFEYLASRGRKRVAVISVPSFPFASCPEIAASMGLVHHAHWGLSATVDAPAMVQPIVQLLMSLPPDERPDGLVIADDNLVENGLAALMPTGVRVPTDLDIVAHCNWPQPDTNILPVRRLGFDVRELLELAISKVDAQRAGETLSSHSLVTAKFEDEL